MITTTIRKMLQTKAATATAQRTQTAKNPATVTEAIPATAKTKIRKAISNN